MFLEPGGKIILSNHLIISTGFRGWQWKWEGGVRGGSPEKGGTTILVFRDIEQWDMWEVEVGETPSPLNTGAHDAPHFLLT